jgi:hypothetical protein
VLVEIDVHGEFAAGRDVVQAAGVEFRIGDEAFDACYALQKIDEAAGMDGAVIEIAGVAEPGLWRGSALELPRIVVAAPIAPVQAVEIGIDEFEKRGREQAVDDDMGDGLGGEEVRAQSRDAVGGEKFGFRISSSARVTPSIVTWLREARAREPTRAGAAEVCASDMGERSSKVGVDEFSRIHELE